MVLVVNVDRCVVAVGVGGGTVPGHATGFLTPMNTTKEDCQRSSNLERTHNRNILRQLVADQTCSRAKLNLPLPHNATFNRMKKPQSQ